MAKEKVTRKAARRAVPKKKKKLARPATRAKAKKPATRAKAKKKPAARRTVRKATPKRSAPTRRPRTTVASLESEVRRLDRDIVKLINRRATCTTRLIESQPNPLVAIFNPGIDQELWAQVQKLNSGPLPHHAVRAVFRAVVSAARQAVRNQRVAYLGPPFSFTHLSAIEQFGESADLIPVNTIASVFEEVNRGHAEFGIVPIENSTDGRIVDTLDMFTRLPLRICGEVQISIHHNLLAKCPRGEITEVYSKPQALSQCRDWLARNMPQARLIEVTSTSTAAQLARDKHGAGAVASQQAALQYDLQIVAERIEDNRDNITRFAVIGEDVTKSTGRDRTALLLQIPHKSGSLADSLVAFKRNRVNLTWIESFPLRGPETGYLFFLDFEGHMNDAKIRKTLTDLKRKAVRLEVLGSYPRSEPLD